MRRGFRKEAKRTMAGTGGAVDGTGRDGTGDDVSDVAQ